MIENYPKRLIEVDLPIKRISAHARREKSIRHGHISTLHIWWARRPLAACRAVICASLWFDPADELCPPEFREIVKMTMREFAENNIGEMSDASYQNFNRIVKKPKELDDNLVLRGLLLDFIADFADWDNSTNEAFLETARFLTHTAHLCLTEDAEFLEAFKADSSIENLKSVIQNLPKPLVVDPFAGGGAIPLEALRVGADAFASDLNPVAVLLNKVVLEYIPRYGEKLAEEVKKWGAWIKEEAEKELAEFYPKDADGATPIAYLWARTVICEGPACGAEIPLLRTLKLSSNYHLKFSLQNKIIDFEIGKGREGIGKGIVKGGAAICPHCSFTTNASRVKNQLADRRGGANSSRLIAVYSTGNGERKFRLSNEDDLNAFYETKKIIQNKVSENPNFIPIEEINPIRPYKNTRGLSAVTRIGCATFGDLYNYRQLLAIRTLYEILSRLELKKIDADISFSVALKSLLALAINRSVSQNTSLSRWDSSRSTIKGAFSKQALQIVWDFAEANPFSGGSADWDSSLDWIIKFIEKCSSIKTPGTVLQNSATKQIIPNGSASAIFTDPPYFSAIPYADLSDFFYVWLHRGLGDLHPDLFNSELTKKGDELIVTNAQLSTDGQSKNDEYFRSNMTSALTVARQSVDGDGIGIIVYAEGTTAGWEAMLSAIISAGWVVTSSWAIDTEMSNRTQAHGAASLQSSVHIVCRPRIIDTVGEWSKVLQELPQRIHEWMPRLRDEGIVGADAIFACLGPALEIFSRYERVEKSSGEVVPLRDYLESVWAAVSKEALQMIFAGADASGFEPDARLTAMWLWTLSTAQGNTDLESRVINALNPNDEADDDEEGTSGKPKTAGFSLEFDTARKIAQGMGINLEELRGTVEIKGELARLLAVKERSAVLFGTVNETAAAKTATRKKNLQQNLFAEAEERFETGVGGWNFADESRKGETVLDRLHQAMLFFAANRSEALKRFLVEDGVGEDERFWRLANALSALYPTNSEEKRWVDGILARKKGLGF
jgi:putative DNA methylase